MIYIYGEVLPEAIARKAAAVSCCSGLREGYSPGFAAGFLATA